MYVCTSTGASVALAWVSARAWSLIPTSYRSWIQPCSFSHVYIQWPRSLHIWELKRSIIYFWYSRPINLVNISEQTHLSALHLLDHVPRSKFIVNDLVLVTPYVMPPLRIQGVQNPSLVSMCLGPRSFGSFFGCWTARPLSFRWIGCLTSRKVAARLRKLKGRSCALATGIS